MALLVPNGGEVIALSYLVGKVTTVRDLVYRLYVNDITPSETDTAGTFTEASGGGYASKSLAGASWTVTGGAPASAAFAQQTWTFSGALSGSATVYGYYVTRATDGDLVLAERFAAPFQPLVNGDAILLTPQITGD